MREVFSGLKIETVAIKYSLGSHSKNPKTSGELIIFNRNEGWGGQAIIIVYCYAIQIKDGLC